MKKLMNTRRFLITSAALTMSVVACQDLTVKLPAGTLDPSQYQTPEAADMMARGTRFLFQYHFLSYMRTSGGFSDEFREHHVNDPVGSFNGMQTEISSRLVPDVRSERGRQLGSGRPAEWPEILGSYSGLQQIRSQALQARQALAAYAPTTPRALRGEMFLYEGYAVVFLADLFCPGVPLTRVNFEGDIDVHPGATTQQLYLHAMALFDSTVLLATDAPSIAAAARIGKARAALALGDYTLADTLVAQIGTGFQYDLPIMGTGTVNASNPTGLNWLSEFAFYSSTQTSFDSDPFSFIADIKGGNGLPYLSSRDPRIRIDSSGNTTNRNGVTNIFPMARTNLVIADHVEARLIQAEAALYAGRSEWLAILNTLRTTGTYTLETGTDTIWTAGTGGVSGLRPLIDPADTAGPGTDIAAARLKLVFDERGYWLFFRGIRQGDLRRLVREYHRPIDAVYPWGIYRGGGGEYGRFIDLPIPDAERKYNGQFLGCQGRES